MRNKYTRLTILFLLFASASLAGTSTWTGASSNDWTVAGNWSGGVPSGASDIVIFPSGASNTSIVNVPTITIKRIEVSGGTYSLTSSSPVTVTCAVSWPC